MKVEIKKEGDGFILEFIETPKSYLYLLKEKLWEIKNVEEVAVIKNHPYFENPKMWVKINNGQINKILKKAVDELISSVDELGSQLKKEGLL